jgi:hypothetical protein
MIFFDGIEPLPHDPEMDRCPDRGAAVELLNLMNDISEDHYAAGWMVGLEYNLWSLAFENPEGNLGFSELSLRNRGRLIELTHRCQGWWIWSDDHGGRKFLSYNDWLSMYQRWTGKDT